MAFREVLVTQVREVLRAWLAGAGKRPAARRAGVDVKTAARYIAAARAAGLARGGDESQLSDELLGLVFTAVFSRYCFVFLTFSQTTAAVIAGCEAAWAFFGGMFTVLVPEYVPRNIFGRETVDSASGPA